MKKAGDWAVGLVVCVDQLEKCVHICRPPVRQLAARALARRVFPVPGGPWKSTPLGGVTSKRWKTSGYSRGNSVISFSAWISDGNSISQGGETEEMKRTIVQTAHFVESNILINTQRVSIRKGCNKFCQSQSDIEFGETNLNRQFCPDLRGCLQQQSHHPAYHRQP